MLDIILSLCVLPFLVLISIPIAILIKLEDGGLIFYRGERKGKNLINFKMYKFRTMKENSEDIRNNDGSTFNSEADYRLTKTGKVLRKTSIDEVPQVINILKGEMSFIGPRPSPLGNEKSYSKEYLRKFSVSPGLTGYNQAYFRNGVSLQKKQENDLYYIDNISFSLDLKILLKTIVTVVKREGLYTNTGMKNDHNHNVSF